MSVAPQNVPRTGSTMLTLLGGHFALHAVTVALRTGSSGCQSSFWRADSTVRCKIVSSHVSSAFQVTLTISRLLNPTMQLEIDNLLPVGNVIFNSIATNISDNNVTSVTVKNSFFSRFVYFGGTMVNKVLWTSSSSLGFVDGKNPSHNQKICSFKIGFGINEFLTFEAQSSLFIPVNYLLQSAISFRASSPASNKFESSDWAQNEFQVGMLNGFAIAVSNNNSQPFHKDGIFFPVTFRINVEVIFRNGSVWPNIICNDVTKYSPIIVTLEAGAFEAISDGLELVFCSEFSEGRIQFSVIGYVEGEPRYTDVFRTDSLRSVGTTPLKSVRIVTKIPSIIESHNQKVALAIEVGSDIQCAQLAFVVSASLMCDESTTFVVNGSIKLSIMALSYRSCKCLLPEWIVDKTSQSCTVRVTISGFSADIQAISNYFSVISGYLYSIEETRPFNQSFKSGDSIFNMINNYGSKCLEAVLLDKQHNWVVSIQTEVKFSSMTNNSEYKIDGDLTSTTSSNALVFWCEITSTYPAFLVVPVFSCDFTSERTKEVQKIHNPGKYTFNVSGVGESKSLVINSAAENINGTFIAERNILPPIQVRYTDLFGNPKVYSNSTAIRITFAALNLQGSIRKLLFENPLNLGQNDLNRCVDSRPSGLIVKPYPVLLQDGSMEAIFFVENLTVCAAGETLMEIDVGLVSSTGQFEVSEATLLSVRIVVQQGSSKFITLSSCNGLEPVIMQSFEQSNENFCVHLLDNGYNLVHGTADITIKLTNQSWKIAPKNTFAVNGSKIVLTNFWFVSLFGSENQSHSKMFISNSSLNSLEYSVAILLRSTCKPGSHVKQFSNGTFETCTNCIPGYYSSFYDEAQCDPCKPGTTPMFDRSACNRCPLNQASPRFGQQVCTVCRADEFSNHNRTSCLTWKFKSKPPTVLISMVPAIIPSLQLHDVIEGKLVNMMDDNMIIEVEVVCFRIENCTAEMNGTLLVKQIRMNKGSDESESCIIKQRLQKQDVSDDWVIQITSAETANFPSVRLILHRSMRLLGTQPVIQTIIPPSVTSNHPVEITLYGTDLLSNELPPKCAPKCTFTRKAVGSRMEVSDSSEIINGNQSDFVTCKTSFPASMWIVDDIEVDVMLQDCRYSNSNFNIKMFCPTRYYQTKSAAEHQCEPCPSPMSVTLKINETSLENCICNIGFYGLYGERCTQCPSHPGFNCSVYGSKVPIIKPGYYIEFDKMHLCQTDQPDCPAIIECPFIYSCPGDTEKSCAGNITQEFCYAGRGCFRCCETYFMHKDKCVRCPPQIGMLIALSVSIVIVAIIGSLSSKNLKPKHVVAMRGFISFFTLCQMVISLNKFGNADNRPQSMEIMFSGVQFFSFSLDIVRPECSISYDAVMKAMIIGLLPIACAIMIVMLSGLVALWKSHHLIQNILKSVPNLKNEISIRWIILHAGMDAFAIQKPAFHRELKLWAALSPFRRVQENLKLKHANPIVDSVKNKYSNSVIRFKRFHGIPWLLIKNECEDEFTEITKSFQSTVNGVFSIILLMYAGTVQASFVVLDCVPRGGSAFLRIDMETECSQANNKYRGLFAVSCLSWIMYGLVVPVGLLILLHSSWSKYIAFCHPAAFNSMFKCLTGQYSPQTPSWEVLQLLKKFIQFGIPAFSIQPVAQALMGIVVGTVYETLVLSFQPFNFVAMNSYESVQNTLILTILMAGLLLDAKILGQALLSEQSQALLGYIVVAAFMFSSYKLIKTYAEATLMEAILYRDSLESRWLSTLREIFSSSIQQSLNGLFSVFMILRHDMIIKNELQQNLNKQNMMLETAKSQTEERLLETIFTQNLADDLAILKLRDSTKYLKTQQQEIIKDMKTMNDRYLLPEESLLAFNKSSHIQALLSHHKISQRIQDIRGGNWSVPLGEMDPPVSFTKMMESISTLSERIMIQATSVLAIAEQDKTQSLEITDESFEYKTRIDSSGKSFAKILSKVYIRQNRKESGNSEGLNTTLTTVSKNTNVSTFSSMLQNAVSRVSNAVIASKKMKMHSMQYHPAENRANLLEMESSDFKPPHLNAEKKDVANSRGRAQEHQRSRFASLFSTEKVALESNAEDQTLIKQRAEEIPMPRQLLKRKAAWSGVVRTQHSDDYRSMRTLPIQTESERGIVNSPQSLKDEQVVTSTKPLTFENHKPGALKGEFQKTTLSDKSKDLTEQEKIADIVAKARIVHKHKYRT